MLSAPYDIAEKDEVEFVVRNGQRGLAATNVRIVDNSKVQKMEERQRGIVTWESDPYKTTPGTIALEGGETEGASSLKRTGPNCASFLHADVDKGSRRVMKGDEVEFDLYTIPSGGYSRARNVAVLRTKRDRQVSDQIKMFAEAGVAMEQGVIDSIKGREFGFIKGCDRADHLFFRLDDLVDQETLCNEVRQLACTSFSPCVLCFLLCTGRRSSVFCYIRALARKDERPRCAHFISAARHGFFRENPRSGRVGDCGGVATRVIQR
jgi:hypothetical protein